MSSTEDSEDCSSKELEDLAKDIEDVTDPSSFEKVLSYYEKLQNDAEDYMELLIRKLEFREITWVQPWYQASSPLTKAHQPFYDRNETETEKFRTDKIIRDEHDRISKNWKRFTKKYNVPDKLKTFICWKNENHRKPKNSPEERVRRFVAAYLARGLERTIYQVFNYIRFFNLREYETRHYSEYEEKIMEVCFMHKVEKAPSILAVVLGRHTRGIYKRRTVLKTGKLDKKRLKWTMVQASKLLKLMLEYSEVTIDELKYKKLDKPFWLKLQEPMDRHYAYLYWFWHSYLHVQLFVKCDVKLYKLRKKLFKLFRDSSYKVWSDIRWNEVEELFPDGFTRQFLYKMCISIVRKHPRYSKTPITDLANFGLATIKSSRYTNKRLKRLILNDEGNLEVIKFNREQNCNES